MLEDFVDQWSVLCRHFDGDPLTQENSDTTAQNVESRFLFLYFDNDCVRQERIEVEMLLQDRGSQTNSCVY